MTEQSAEERARDAVAKWGLPASAGQLISAITAANLTIIDKDELAQLRAEAYCAQGWHKVCSPDYDPCDEDCQ